MLYSYVDVTAVARKGFNMYALPDEEFSNKAIQDYFWNR
jgi:hypothetical protein